MRSTPGFFFLIKASRGPLPRVVTWLNRGPDGLKPLNATSGTCRRTARHPAPPTSCQQHDPMTTPSQSFCSRIAQSASQSSRVIRRPNICSGWAPMGAPGWWWWWGVVVVGPTAAFSSILWSGVLLSLAACCQVAVWSGYAKSTVHGAVPRLLRRCPWDTDATIRWCCHMLPCLPAPYLAVLTVLKQWLRNAQPGAAPRTHLGTCHNPPPCTDLYVDWSADYPVLQSLIPPSAPSMEHIWGPQGRGMGVQYFPVVLNATVT